MMGQSKRPAVQSASTPDAKCRKTMKIAGVSEALSPLKNASIQLIITSLAGRPQYWWHHQRPLILNELAVFLSLIPLQVTTLVTTSTIIYWIIARYACCAMHTSIVLILPCVDYQHLICYHSSSFAAIQPTHLLQDGQTLTNFNHNHGVKMWWPQSKSLLGHHD